MGHNIVVSGSPTSGVLTCSLSKPGWSEKQLSLTVSGGTGIVCGAYMLDDLYPDQVVWSDRMNKRSVWTRGEQAAPAPPFPPYWGGYGGMPYTGAHPSFQQGSARGGKGKRKGEGKGKGKGKTAKDSAAEDGKDEIHADADGAKRRGGSGRRIRHTSDGGRGSDAVERHTTDGNRGYGLSPTLPPPAGACSQEEALHRDACAAPA